MSSSFLAQSKQIFEDLVPLRRHLHRHPELSYAEFETTDFIINYLQPLGFEIHRPLQTGCVAVLRGGASSRVVALRADIDALPIQESGEHKQDFLSENEGVAHCCGHDLHTTNLLGAARLIAEHKNELSGTVVLVFQPGEEKTPGGGRLLMETGFLQKLNIQRMYGLHSDPNHAPGTISVKDGAMMARPDEFVLRIVGKGGHAAKPHEALDPIVMGAQVVGALQTIVSRHRNPIHPAVVTVGKFSGGSTYNIIPEAVDLMGTIRSFDGALSAHISDLIERMARGIVEPLGGEVDYRFQEGYPALINPAELNNTVRSLTDTVLGGSHLNELQEPVMAGEDFAFYQQELPACFFFLGTGSDEADSRYVWHHPKYNVDERALINGVALLTALAFEG